MLNQLGAELEPLFKIRRDSAAWYAGNTAPHAIDKSNDTQWNEVVDFYIAASGLMNQNISLMQWMEAVHHSAKGVICLHSHDQYWKVHVEPPHFTLTCDLVPIPDRLTNSTSFC